MVAAASTSFSMIRPPGPEPVMEARSTPLSAATFLARGLALTLPPGGASRGGGGAVEAAIEPDTWTTGSEVGAWAAGLGGWGLGSGGGFAGGRSALPEELGACDSGDGKTAFSGGFAGGETADGTPVLPAAQPSGSFSPSLTMAAIGLPTGTVSPPLIRKPVRVPLPGDSSSRVALSVWI